MRYFKLCPEVGGGEGENTIADRSGHPPIVSHLHYKFDVYLGDDLIEGFPCYIVTQKLANLLKGSDLTGFGFKPVEVTTSEIFRDVDPKQRLPKFLWLDVRGKPFKDDFGLIKPARLVVSERALEVLRKMQLDFCDVSEVFP